MTAWLLLGLMGTIGAAEAAPLRPGKVRSLARQCEKGKAVACATVAQARAQHTTIALPADKAMDYAKRACELEEPVGCQAYAALVTQGFGTRVPAAEGKAAFESLERGCELGAVEACSEGIALVSRAPDMDVAIERVASLAERGCKTGNPELCTQREGLRWLLADDASAELTGSDVAAMRESLVAQIPKISRCLEKAGAEPQLQLRVLRTPAGPVMRATADDPALEASIRQCLHAWVRSAAGPDRWSMPVVWWDRGPMNEDEPPTVKTTPCTWWSDGGGDCLQLASMTNERGEPTDHPCAPPPERSSSGDHSEHSDHASPGNEESKSGKGAIPRSAIDDVIMGHLGRIRYCYESGLARDPGLQGKLAVKFTIAPDGSVCRASRRSGDISDPRVVGCVLRRFMSMRFPAPQGDGIVIVSYPFAFLPGR